MRSSRLPVQGTGALLFILFLSAAVPVRIQAEEGMWIPMLLEKYQIGRLKEAGLEISADEIYSINQACLKDAVVIFGTGCTGEVISGEGLLLTNHHCGEESVQSHSTVGTDYLSNGFWAMSREEELPNEGLSVTFLRYMDDVTEEIVSGTRGLDPQEMERRLELNMGQVIGKATQGNDYSAIVKPVYYGNAYFLFVYEVFRDVRLVGAPPVSIGNFGADRDNWTWPRHTGDFTLFRIYAGEGNRPAEYAPGNRPYKPRKALEINAGGIEEGAFTMILGYPGSTTLYLYSRAVSQMIEQRLPLKIGLRTKRLEIMEHFMKDSDRIRILYTTKYRDVSNSWKKWQGIILGLERNRMVERKISEEESFRLWVDGEGERQLKYDTLLSCFERVYRELEPYGHAVDMLDEAVMAVELFRQAPRFRGMMMQGLPAGEIKEVMEGFYRGFFMPIDRDVFGLAMESYGKEMPKRFRPSFIEFVNKKYAGDYGKFAERVYRKSLLSDSAGVMKVIDTYRRDPEKAIKLIDRDPLFNCFNQLRDIYVERILPEYDRLERELKKMYRYYMSALMEKAAQERLAPDANFTMRLTYGSVEGYSPWDGIQYGYSTTLSGIIEKSAGGLEEYQIPDRLKELYDEKDYGRYGVDGTMPVCFLASNHTSGGNSGSPVLDARGRLIGINFDRNWEGTMSDVHYDPALCRNISVDIRYVLFVIDKFAGAGYLVDEMDIVW